MWLHFPTKNISRSEGTWLCDQISSQKFFPFWGDLTVIVTYGMKSIIFWGNLTMWLYFSVKNLSHSEGNWLCDYTFQPKIYPILRGPDYVIIISSQKSIPFWGDLTMWLYFPAKKSIPFLGDLTVIVTYGMKSITSWGDLTMWLYFPVKNLSHSEGNWLCDYTFQPKIYPILRGPDYVIILSSQKSIPFLGDLTVIVNYGMKSITSWGDLTMWLFFPVKNLSHSEGNWLCDYTFQPKIYPILRGPDKWS